MPLAIDLFCGLGGWTDGLLAEGFDVVGFDVERHEYGDHRYPAQLVLQDVLTLHGRQFKDAALIVASPPCQEYSYMAMPWSRAKAIAAEYRSGKRDVADLNRLFDACFRIQREAYEAAGRHIPMVVENVRGAQPWVGRSRWNFGSFHLWGDVPALMPITVRQAKVGGFSWSDFGKPDYVPQAFNGTAERRIKNTGGSWFAVAHNTTSGKGRNPDGRKNPGIELGNIGFNVASAHQFGHMVEGAKIERSDDDKRQHIGIKRKFASAMIAKIPLPLSRWIARAYRGACL